MGTTHLRLNLLHLGQLVRYATVFSSSTMLYTLPGNGLKSTIQSPAVDFLNQNHSPGWLENDTAVGLDQPNLLARSSPASATALADLTSTEIRGTQWNDQNGNGIQDAGEPGLAGGTVYLDQNRNGRLDAEEPFTLTDANGNYVFGNLVPGIYAVAIVPPVDWQRTSPTQTNSSNLIAVADRRDLIVDPLRNILYLPTSTGKVERYDIATHRLLSPWQVGNSLNGGDITPDSSALYIAENQQGATQGFVRKVNLATGAVTNLTTPNADWDTNPSDVTIGPNGLGLVRRRGQWQSMLELNLSTDTITTRSDSGSIFGGGQISRSGDRSLFLITQDGISSGPISTYNAVTNTFSGEKRTNAYLGNNLSAVNRDGSLISIEWGTGISILDRNLNSVENLSGVDGGLTFDPLRDILYAANSSTDQVIAFDTHTWQELYRLNIGEDIPASDSWDASSRPFGNGMMTVSADGNHLFIATPSGVRMVDLLPIGTQVVTLTDGQVAAAVNFGAQQRVTPSSSIAGSLWNDLNSNGLREWNESGLAGRTVYLDQNKNGVLDVGETATITNSTGDYRFTDLAPGTYTVAEVVPTGWQQTTPVASQSTLLPIRDRRDLIFDPLRNRLYMTTSDGDVERYDIATGNLLTPWHVGNSLNGGDITSDGSALYIAENQQGATQGFVRKVNLETGAVTNLTTPDADWDTNPSDVTIGSNGIGLIRRRGQWQSMLALNLSTDTISTQPISGGLLYGGDLIARSSDRSLLLIRGADGLFTYSSATNTFSAQRAASANSFFAVNRNGTRIAVEVGSSISILDSNLNGVENLTNVDGGLAFDPTKDVLYAASSATSQIIAFDTNTWRELYRFNIGEDIRPAYSYDDPSKPLGNGVMTVSEDGKFLFLSTPLGVRVFNLNQMSDGNQTYTLNVAAGQAVTGLTFGNQPTPAFSVSDVSVVEGDSGTRSMVFTVQLSVARTQTTTVDYTTADGTAIAGSDYTAIQGTLTFNPGETTKTIVVPILGDTLDEADETFRLQLSHPTNAEITLNAGTATGRIVNDDQLIGSDFNSDGKVDILWRHSQTGQLGIWLLNGTQYDRALSLPIVSDLNWKTEATADFDGDGDLDLLWRHSVTGQTGLWILNGTRFENSIALLDVPDRNWQIEGTADFNRDGTMDIVWRHHQTGDNAVWLMNQARYSSSALLTRVADLNWKIEQVADLDGDGDGDLLWRNSKTGLTGVWLMNQTSLDRTFTLGSVPDSNWQIAGTADLDSDGNLDIVWRHAKTGQNAVWLLNGNSNYTPVALQSAVGEHWKISNLNDYDGDGDVDLLWRNEQTGQTVIWTMNGVKFDAAVFLPPAHPSWMII